MEWCYLCGTSFDNIKRLGDEAHAPNCMYNPRRANARRDEEQAAQGQLTQLVHGGPVSDTLARAREARNQRIRAEMRPRLAEAAEKRAKEAKETERKQKEQDGEAEGKKKRVHLHAPWEER
jgi:hypothetical protein